MDQVAALAQRAQIAPSVIPRIVVEMRGRQHDSCLPKPDGVLDVRPARRLAASVAPRALERIEPATVGQHAQCGAMRAKAALTGARLRARTGLPPKSAASPPDTGLETPPGSASFNHSPRQPARQRQTRAPRRCWSRVPPGAGSRAPLRWICAGSGASVRADLPRHHRRR